MTLETLLAIRAVIYNGVLLSTIALIASAVFIVTVQNALLLPAAVADDAAGFFLADTVIKWGEKIFFMATGALYMLIIIFIYLARRLKCGCEHSWFVHMDKQGNFVDCKRCKCTERLV